MDIIKIFYCQNRKDVFVNDIIVSITIIILLFISIIIAYSYDIQNLYYIIPFCLVFLLICFFAVYEKPVLFNSKLIFNNEKLIILFKKKVK